MSVLNIFDSTGDPTTGWRHTEKISETAISQLKDRSAKTTNALNAVPSPFSRLHTFETAFKLVTGDLIDGQDRASEIYRELVSDCLDAIELVFNAGYHESQGDKLTFVNWKVEQLDDLRKGVKGQQILAKTLQTFIGADFPNREFNLSIVKYKGLAIAGSSPFTLMFTTSNLDKSRSERPDNRFRSSRYNSGFDLVNPGTRSPYFSKIVPFSERSKDFQIYLISLFEESPALKTSGNKVLWDYLVAQGAGQLPLRHLKTKANFADNGGTFESFGTPIQTGAETLSTEIFNDHVIRTIYRINQSGFYVPGYKNDSEEREFDFLLPVKPEFLAQIDPRDIPRFFTYELIGERLKVSFQNASMEKPKTKEFNTIARTKTEGKIVQMGKDFDYPFLVGVFPHLKVINEDGSSHQDYNDFYKICLAVDGGGNPTHLKTDNFSLEFFRKGDGVLEKITSEGRTYNAMREVRRKFESPDALASIYYQVNGTTFDLIKINIQNVDGLDNVTGMIVPKWKEKRVGDKRFDFSVDFGTTNTFVAYTDDPEHRTMPKPFDISLNELQMVMLQHSPEARGGLSVTDSFWRNTGIAQLVKLLLANEFVPPVFLPGEAGSVFTMPFRTAVFQKKNINTFNLFSDLNVHFGYQKTIIDQNAIEWQEIIANLKWNVSSLGDLGAKYRVEKFIEELCMLFKHKVLLNGGNPKLTRLNWFIPQSLSEASIDLYEEIWVEKVFKVLKSEQRPKKVFESEAPYYFLERTGKIENSDAVLTIDIGGGSTDAMLFNNKTPLLGTSFNFAGNILWSNGYNQLSNDAKDNGFYQKLHELLKAEIEKDPDLRRMIRAYEYKSTDEIINFWLANNDKLKVTDYLKDPEFKIVYLFHFFSVIYHLAQWIKANGYGGPTCVIFSGNGSKYIDFIASDRNLSRIIGYIFEKVLGKEVKSPQIILPTENRKEATSYGGIFKKREEDFRSQSFLGTTVEFASSHSIKTYNDVENNITHIRPSIRENIMNMLDILSGLNDVVNFKSQLNISFNIDSVRGFIESQLDSNFEKGYSIRKEKISYDENVSDSLFFYPLIGIIFELGKLNEEKLNAFTPRVKKYVVEPSGKDLFMASALNPDRSFNSIFEVSIPINNPNEATFSLIAEEPVYLRAYTSQDFVLSPVCEINGFPNEHKIVFKQLNTGKLRKDGDNWVVSERLKLEFI